MTQKKEIIPVLRNLVFLNNHKLCFPDGKIIPLSKNESGYYKLFLKGGFSLQDLIPDINGDPEGEKKVQEIRRQLQKMHIFSCFEYKYRVDWDVVIISHGVGGCHVYAVDLWTKLNKFCNALLISPEEPFYGYPQTMSKNLITFPRLLKSGFPFKNPRLSFIHFIRTVLKKINVKLVLFTHRSFSMYFTDILRDSKVIIHSDDYNDPVYNLAYDFEHEMLHEDNFSKIQNLYFSIAYGHDYPHGSLISVLNGYNAMKNAKEYWCYSKPLYSKMLLVFPYWKSKIKFVPPMVDTDIYTPDWNSEKRWILMTTSMQNIDKKGVPELIKAMEYVKSFVKVLFLVKYKDKVSSFMPRMNRRVTIQTVPKDELKSVYDQAYLYCRLSREDSVPYSLLEAMASGLPVVVSPVIAAGLPVIEDGVNGFVIEPDNHKDFAEKIDLLVSDQNLRKKMGEACSKSVQLYSYKNNIGRITTYF